MRTPRQGESTADTGAVSANAIDPKALPKRIILCRKGSDAAWGGRPSLRLGTELISLPIPESAHRARAAAAQGEGLRYADLPRHRQLGALHTFLRGIQAQDFVHLDPDLRPGLRDTRARQQDAVFGQTGAAEQHLRHQDVGPGDLFLFFGWFRDVVRSGTPTAAGSWKRSGPDEHCIWGWLQVGEMAAVSSPLQARQTRWAARHPHVRYWDRFNANNRVYRARKRLTFLAHTPGASVFRYHPALTLTRRCEASTRGAWCLPGFIRATGLTYNRTDGPACPADSRQLHLTAAPIGQEFVLPAHREFLPEERGDVAGWLATLFQAAEGVSL